MPRCPGCGRRAQLLIAGLCCPFSPQLHCAVPACLPSLQENILAESTAMLPDTRQRLEEALQELQGLVVSAAAGRDPWLQQLPWWAGLWFCTAHSTCSDTFRSRVRRGVKEGYTRRVRVMRC